MNLSKKSRYGLRALIDLSVNSKFSHVALATIAERNDISQQYLEQIFSALKKAGIVRSVKGPQGGYMLAEDSGNISVSDILKALEGDYLIEEENIMEESPGQPAVMAVQKMVVERLNRELVHVLENVTLADLEREYQEYREFGQNMYYI